MMLAESKSETPDWNWEPANAFVRKTSHFGCLSENDIAALDFISARPRSVQARFDLVQEGDTPDGALIILEGLACRYRYLDDGRRQIIAFLLPGDLCDLDCALLGRMDHAIGTVTACSVVRVSSEILGELTDEHPRLALALRRAKLAEEATLRDWVVSLGRRRATERLAYLLCELLSRLEAVGLAAANGCDLPITQIELGDATGLSSVHVNRSLQALRATGFIQLAARRLQVTKIARLRTFCEFPPLQAKGIANGVALGSQPVMLGAA